MSQVMLLHFHISVDLQVTHESQSSTLNDGEEKRKRATKYWEIYDQVFVVRLRFLPLWDKVLDAINANMACSYKGA